MLLLNTTAHPTLYQHPGPAGEQVHPGLGRLIQPRHTSSIEQTAAERIPWPPITTAPGARRREVAGDAGPD